ncbi:hypothetical protein PIB30_099999, partial [Stylosanthes scabra]|nr:hypothetical protein [Stylosanthes scabra]
RADLGAARCTVGNVTNTAAEALICSLSAFGIATSVAWSASTSIVPQSPPHRRRNDDLSTTAASPSSAIRSGDAIDAIARCSSTPLSLRPSPVLPSPLESGYDGLRASVLVDFVLYC